jgi:hypothetical protein
MALNPGVAPVLSLSSDPGGGITLSVDTNGLWTANLTLVAGSMLMLANWPFTPYYHELEVTDAAGDIVNTTTGTIFLKPSLNAPN